jgi:hypothetical protein
MVHYMHDTTATILTLQNERKKRELTGPMSHFIDTWYME